jgi:hypothetical protein
MFETLAVALVLPPRRETRGADLHYQCFTSLTSPQSRWVFVLIIVVLGKGINEFVGTSNKLTKYITRLVTSGRCQRWPAGRQFNSAALIRPMSLLPLHYSDQSFSYICNNHIKLWTGTHCGHVNAFLWNLRFRRPRCQCKSLDERFIFCVCVLLFLWVTACCI